MLLNPGSCGPRRFHQDITMAYVTVKQDGNFQITRIDIPQKTGMTLKNEKNLKSQIERTIQEIKKEKVWNR